jgi:phosphoserine phosphatase RsbU/P
MLKNYSEMLKEQKDQILSQSEKIAAQQKTLEEKNKVLELKTAEIEDLYTDQTQSIMYAKRIQKAILTPDEIISSTFPDHFVIYQPRDIISGDFYWVKKRNDKVLVAVGDCTGHGVPGALMTMLSMSLLDEISDQNTGWSPDHILNILRAKIISTLHQKSITDENKDGLDLSICVFDLPSRRMEFSGAFNPILYYKDNQLNLVKADKMPIGVYHPEYVPFTKQVFNINKGDTIFMYSDGFADQFGGPENKKFMMRRFRETIFQNIDRSMTDQKQLLIDAFGEWRGSSQQVDDIVVLGIKL